MKELLSSPRRLLFACAASLMLTGSSLELKAQGQSPALLSVRVVQVKPEKVAQWEDLQKELSAAMKKAGQSRSIWQVVRGDINTYHIVTGLQKFGDLDKPTSPPIQGAAWGRWVSRVSECVEDRQSMILRTNPDLNIPLKEGRKWNLLLLTKRRHATGRGAEYSAALTKELYPALKKGGVNGYSTARVVSGGSTRTWVDVEYLDNWADLDGPGPLRRALGENAGKLGQKLGSMIDDAERIVLRFREDLSASGSN